jgi:hypothetical protein
MPRRATDAYEIEEELVTECHKTVCQMRDEYFLAIHGERLNQRRPDKAGSDVGSPDYLLVVNGWHHPLEFKRSKGGRFSVGQMVAAERRRAALVETYAPNRLLHFDALVKWSMQRTPGSGRLFLPVCPDCPTVPPVPEP